MKIYVGKDIYGQKSLSFDKDKLHKIVGSWNAKIIDNEKNRDLIISYSIYYFTDKYFKNQRKKWELNDFQKLLNSLTDLQKIQFITILYYIYINRNSAWDFKDKFVYDEFDNYEKEIVKGVILDMVKFGVLKKFYHNLSITEKGKLFMKYFDLEMLNNLING